MFWCTSFIISHHTSFYINSLSGDSPHTTTSNLLQKSWTCLQTPRSQFNQTYFIWLERRGCTTLTSWVDRNQVCGLLRRKPGKWNKYRGCQDVFFYAERERLAQSFSQNPECEVKPQQAVQPWVTQPRRFTSVCWCWGQCVTLCSISHLNNI